MTVVGSSALAQPAVPGRVPDWVATILAKNRSAVSSTDVMRIMDYYGQCLVTSRSGLVTTIIAVPADPEAIKRGLKREEVIDCVQPLIRAYGWSMVFDPELLRGSVFKALYQQRFRKAVPAFAAPGDAPGPAATADAAARRAHAIQQIADCSLTAAPTTVDAVVRNSYGSAAHGQAFAQLAPVIGSCLPEGLELALPRPLLAGALAEAAWHRAEKAAD